MNKNLILLLGITFMLVGFILKKFYKYYEVKILPKKSILDQEKYYKRQSELSKMGAYNVPFKDGKLISTNNNIHDRNNFVIILGVIAFVLALIL